MDKNEFVKRFRQTISREERLAMFREHPEYARLSIEEVFKDDLRSAVPLDQLIDTLRSIISESLSTKKKLLDLVSDKELKTSLSANWNKAIEGLKSEVTVQTFGNTNVYSKKAA